MLPSQSSALFASLSCLIILSPPLTDCFPTPPWSSTPRIKCSQPWPNPEQIEGPVKMQIAGLEPQVLIQEVGVGAWEFALLTSSQVMLMPLVWGPHFENHCGALARNKHFCLEFLLFNPPIFPSLREGDGNLANTQCGKPPLLSDFIFLICKMGTVLFSRSVRVN